MSVVLGGLLFAAIGWILKHRKVSPEEARRTEELDRTRRHRIYSGW